MLLILLYVIGLALAIEASAPKFSEVYSARIDCTDLFIGARTPLQVWFDRSQHRVRADHYGNMSSWLIIDTTKDRPNGGRITVFPMSTQAELNKRACKSHFHDVPFAVHSDFLDFLLPQLDETGYKYFGKDIIHGEESEKWQYVGPVEVRNFWFNYKMLNGTKQAVPIRYENIVSLNVNGYSGWVIRHYLMDFYDFSVAPIDPEIFNIQEGLNCTEIKNEFESVLPTMGMSINGVFSQYKSSYGRQYRSQEEQQMRQQIFTRNVRAILEHNRAGLGFKLGVNHLADRTPQELAMLHGRIPTDAPSQGLPFPYTDAEIKELSKDLPKEFDWRRYGAVTTVRDHFTCASGWAFGAVGAVEGALFLHNNRSGLVRLSEQALIDCSWGFNNSGCGGGHETHAYEFMKKHGLPSHSDYGDYIAENGYCHIASVYKEVTVSDYFQVKQFDENALKLAIVKHGPVSVAIDPSGSFFKYRSGVYENPNCKSDAAHLTRLVLAIGYGEHEGQRYWLLKNDWNTWWGEGGYMMMATEGNMCGVLTSAHYVTVE